MEILSYGANEFKLTLQLVSSKNKTQFKLLTITARDYKDNVAQIVDVIVAALLSGDEIIRKSLYRVKKRWNRSEVFLPTILDKLDIEVKKIDPAWPLKKTTTQEATKIETNSHSLPQSPEVHAEFNDTRLGSCVGQKFEKPATSVQSNMVIKRTHDIPSSENALTGVDKFMPFSAPKRKLELTLPENDSRNVKKITLNPEPITSQGVPSVNMFNTNVENSQQSNKVRVNGNFYNAMFFDDVAEKKPEITSEQGSENRKAIASSLIEFKEADLKVRYTDVIANLTRSSENSCRFCSLTMDGVAVGSVEWVQHMDEHIKKSLAKNSTDFTRSWYCTPETWPLPTTAQPSLVENDKDVNGVKSTSHKISKF